MIPADLSHTFTKGLQVKLPVNYVLIIISAFHNAGSNAYMEQVSYHRVHMFYASSDRFEIPSVMGVFFRISSRYISLRFQRFHNACISLFLSLLWDHIRTRTDQSIQLDHVFPFRSPLSIQRIAFYSLNQRFAHYLSNKKTAVCFMFIFLLVSRTSVCFCIFDKTHRQHEPFLRNEDNTMDLLPRASIQHIPAFLHCIRHHRPIFHTCDIC